LDKSLSRLGLAPETTRDLRSSEIKLAALGVPAGIDSSTAAEITAAIDRSFVYGFRAVLLICVALSMASALFAWRLIGHDVRSP
jgi:hypothetical protein